MACPDELTLDLWLADALPSDEAAEVATHARNMCHVVRQPNGLRTGSMASSAPHSRSTPKSSRICRDWSWPRPGAPSPDDGSSCPGAGLRWLRGWASLPGWWRRRCSARRSPRRPDRRGHGVAERGVRGGVQPREALLDLIRIPLSPQSASARAARPRTAGLATLLDSPKEYTLMNVRSSFHALVLGSALFVAGAAERCAGGRGAQRHRGGGRAWRNARR